jgi:UDP-N-acetylmuramate dehydrogenase
MCLKELFMSEFYNGLCDIFGNNNIRVNEPLKNYTTFRIGGEADYLVKPSDSAQLALTIKLCKEHRIPYFVLGNGSNLLVSDRGYRGVIIWIGRTMDEIKVDGCRMIVGAGAPLIRASVEAKNHGLSGLEFASGIPGTIGGAVYMNAGAYGGEMKNVIASVKVMDGQGQIFDIAGSDMRFSYRHSIAGDKELVILEVTMELEYGDKKAIEEKMNSLAAARIEKQPLDMPSAGSTFKRPEGYFAGKLIMDAGLRGFTVGGAQISEKHCGFVVNTGNSTAEDVICLIRKVQEIVRDKYGVSLETEVKMLGDF